MEILHNHSLKSYNSFGIEANAKQLVRFDNEAEIREACLAGRSGFILGGGSNILLMNDIDGEVWSCELRGIEVIKEHDDCVLVKIGAGEIWHDVVLWAVANAFGGIENLALIPGKTGAAPIQNIGAYGVEIKDVLHSLEAIRKKDGQVLSFFNSECEFGYRDSIFKNALKDQCIISSCTLKLSKEGYHKLDQSYGAISKTLEEQGVNQPTIHDIAQAVIKIRSSKLPDINKIGNAGSFFKNPIIEGSAFETLKSKFPDIVSYPAGNDKVKVPAGWLIDKAGWKGTWHGNVGCYEKQALVLISNGKATGEEIFELSERIMKSISDKYGINLEREVNLVF